MHAISLRAICTEVNWIMAVASFSLFTFTDNCGPAISILHLIVICVSFLPLVVQNCSCCLEIHFDYQMASSACLWQGSLQLVSLIGSGGTWQLATLVQSLSSFI